MIKKLAFFLVLLFSMICLTFAAKNFNSKEIVLEKPYTSKQEQGVKKNVDAKEIISENVSSLYDKASTIKNNFEINKLFESIKKFIVSVKIFVLKIKLGVSKHPKLS
ncbi:MAG: hypothetical protein LBF23_03295 [Endomicrobium sp.]|jgi:hypothetical protein|nr:hypothetical protein [Endomicrobium sp.]